VTHGKWIVRKGRLSLEIDGGATLSVTARQVFDCEFRNAGVVEGISVAERPSTSLSTIAFSKFPLQMILQLRTTPDGRPHPIDCAVRGRRRGVDIELPSFLCEPDDHIIVESSWHPFEPDGAAAIRDALAKVGVSRIGPISLGQYLRLTQLGQSNKLLVLQDDARPCLNASRVRADQSTGSIQGFRANLYPYQLDGVRWLYSIADEALGGILADEMGLGKTIQIIALIAREIAFGRRISLIICPATLLENWRREIDRFAPGLRVVIHRGAERTGFAHELNPYDVVLSSYETVTRDLSMLERISWNVLVLDEAQAIKNPTARRTLAAKRLPRRTALAVTGTPLENRLTDLWSLMDFVVPGYFGSEGEFTRRYADDVRSASALEPYISPFMLRRKLRDVAADLPDRIDIPQALTLSDATATEYECLRAETEHEYGALGTLVALGRLRMFCAHPFLVRPERSDPLQASSKLQRLMEILDEVFQNGEKCLVFTSYREMIDIIVESTSKAFPSAYTGWIDGRVGVSDRQSRVDEFSSAIGPGALVLNPKAAGTGLNITAANHVAHYNLEWNPAVEDQASARAHRRGQQLPVTVHRLFYSDTVEEVVNDRLVRKRDIADAAVVGHVGKEADLEDIARAMAITPVSRRHAHDGGA
jgi:SNF2 family DNA or RNA helicase